MLIPGPGVVQDKRSGWLSSLTSEVIGPRGHHVINSTEIKRVNGYTTQKKTH